MNRRGKRMKWIEEENRQSILKSLEKQSLRFKELLKKLGVSRATLSKHLKELETEMSIEKIYDVKAKGIVYRIKEKGIVETYIESWVKHLGIVAVQYIVRRNLNLPTKPHYDIYEEIDNYANLKLETQTWKQMLAYLEKKGYVIEEI